MDYSRKPQYTPFINSLQPIYEPFLNFLGHPSRATLPRPPPKKFRNYCWCFRWWTQGDASIDELKGMPPLGMLEFLWKVSWVFRGDGIPWNPDPNKHRPLEFAISATMPKEKVSKTSSGPNGFVKSMVIQYQKGSNPPNKNHLQNTNPRMHFFMKGY